MRKILGMIILLSAICIIIYVGNQRFVSQENAHNLTRHIALLAIFAIGEGIVILSGGIDLSVGSVIAFSGVFLTQAIVERGMPPIVAGLLVIGIGVVIGLWHGFLITRIRLQPFIATLCTMLILRGQARVLVEEQTMGFGNGYPGVRALGDGFFLGLPTPVVILAGVAIVAAFFMHFTIYGRYLYAIGRNPQAAEYSGVKVARMQTAAYVACGGLAALAGILYASYTNSVQPASTGLAYELYAIAAAVLGGCSLSGGQGTVIGIIVGAAIMRVMANGINLLGIAPAWEFAVLGYVILIGVVGDSIYKQRGAKRLGPKDKRTDRKEDELEVEEPTENARV
ncbi:MAG: ABC transporter permease [Armatimonadetes bacterium]|nr:ABC transporter permease [Armatimonadota bacterium]